MCSPLLSVGLPPPCPPALSVGEKEEEAAIAMNIKWESTNRPGREGGREGLLPTIFLVPLPPSEVCEKIVPPPPPPRSYSAPATASHSSTSASVTSHFFPLSPEGKKKKKTKGALTSVGRNCAEEGLKGQFPKICKQRAKSSAIG